MCSKNVVVGLFGSLYFIGYMLGALFLTSMGDTAGRITAVILGQTLNSVGFVIIAAFHNTLDTWEFY